MTFTYTLCGNVTNINTFPRFVGVDTTGNAQPIGIDFTGNGMDAMFANVNGDIYGFRNNGNNIWTTSPYIYKSEFMVGYYTNLSPIHGVFPTSLVTSRLNVVELFDLHVEDTGATGIGGGIVFSFSGLMSSPVISYDLNKILVGLKKPTNSGYISSIYIRPGEVHTTRTDSVSNKPLTYFSKSTDTLVNFIDSSFASFALGRFSSSSSIDTVKITSDNKILINGSVISANIGITTIYSSPVIGDLNKDGNQDIIFTADNKVFAINQHGVLLDNFPFSIVGVNKISSGCAVADLNSDGVNEVIFGTVDGRVYAYSSNGKILDGFPLATGGEIKSTPAIINSGGNFGLLVYSQDGYLYGYKTPWSYDSTKVIWRNFLRDKYHSNSNFDVSNPISSGPCLPSDKVYNWPNPAYGSSTNIRYFLNGDASSVKIKIMDLSGELVTTLTGTTNKGFDNEVPWDITKVQSGIYLAVVELEGGCGETASIKIAVVK